MRYRFLIPVFFLCMTSCETEGGAGCTDSSATNFDPSATLDDGSCEYAVVEGCTDPEALNYNPEATSDDGSCEYAVVEGCTDPEAINYNPEATIDDGSCEYSVSNECPSDLLFDGYTYDIVEIGDQCWFAENLQSTSYAQGGVIQEVTDDAEWSQLTTPALCIYENEASNVQTYGRLYNGFAVTSELGLCPEGWHVPTTEEWAELEVFAGVPVDDIGTLAEWLGEEEGVGTALKATEGWSNNGSGTDLFGFSAMPGGSRFYSDGSFFSGGDYGLWWTSSPIESDLFHRSLWNQEQGILQFSVPLEVGAAVRCLQD